jgi:ABC-type dipeptide/oligopeptide/nickel transport system permease subunit
MMSADGRAFMIVNPWMLFFPTAALGLVVFAGNMLGDSLRDELDPRLRGRG